MVTTTQFSVQIYYYNTAMYYHDLTSIAPLCTPSVEMALVQNSRVVEAGRRRVTLAVNPWDSLLRYFHKLNPIPASPFNMSVRMRRNWKLWKVYIKDCERGQDHNNFETIDDDSLFPPFNISVRMMRSSRITTGRLHISMQYIVVMRTIERK